jgi:hypothetical protein
MGFKPEIIARHLIQRRPYFRGFPIDRLALEGRRGVIREIEAGRYRPRPRGRLERPDPFRAPEEPARIPGFGTFREKPSIFPGVGRNKPRQFNKLI